MCVSCERTASVSVSSLPFLCLLFARFTLLFAGGNAICLNTAFGGAYLVYDKSMALISESSSQNMFDAVIEHTCDNIPSMPNARAAPAESAGCTRCFDGRVDIGLLSMTDGILSAEKTRGVGSFSLSRKNG